MTTPRYAVTAGPVHGFIVTRDGAHVGHAPTRYKARALAGADAERRRVLGEWCAARIEQAVEKRRAELKARAAGEATRLRGWRVDGRPER